MELCFWSLIVLSLYGYFGYPVLLYCCYCLFPRSAPQYSAGESRFSVSILVAAFNEEGNIKEKINTLLAQEYPADLFDIWILDDGSTDQTAAIVRACTDPRVNLLCLPRSGKATALNGGVGRSRGEIIVFSDADTIWLSSTLANLVAPFSAAATGAVAGRLKTGRQTARLGFGDKMYHGYESSVRLWETALASAVSADGGLFAIRRELWEELPQDVTDDFFISTAAVARGLKIIFAEKAVAFDSGVEKARSQLKKRIRITVRGLTSLWRRRELFNPWRFGLYSIFLVSHKLIRRLVPAFLLLLLPVNAALIHAGGWYRTFLALQLFFYSLALLGFVVGTRKNTPKIVRLTSFAMLNSYGVLVGLLQFILGKRYTCWVPGQNR